MEEVNFQKQYSLRSNQFHRQLKNYTRDSKPKSLPFRVQQIMYPQLVNVPRKPGQVDCYGWLVPSEVPQYSQQKNICNKKIYPKNNKHRPSTSTVVAPGQKSLNSQGFQGKFFPVPPKYVTKRS